MIHEKLLQLHRFVNGMLRDAEIEIIRKEGVKLQTCDTTFGKQRSMALDDCEDILRCPCVRINHSLTEKSSYFCAANIEHVAVGGEELHVYIVLLRHHAVA